MKRRAFLGKGIKGALAAVIGGSAAIALKDEASAYCTWVRRNRMCMSNGQTWGYYCYQCANGVTYECRWKYESPTC